MKEEKKSKRKTFYPVFFCLLLAGLLLTAPFQAAAREKPVFTVNPGLFNHYGNDDGLFSKSDLSGMEMSNQAQAGPLTDKPRVNPGKLFGEIVAGVLGNVAGGFLGGVIGHTAAKSDDSEWFDGFDGMVIGYFTGSAFGSALGVYAIGNSGNTKGSFAKALLGSFLGEGAAILVMMITKNGEAAIISFIILPPIGAALLFNSSLKYKSLPVSHALLNFDRGDFRVGIPYVHIQPVPGYTKDDKPSISFGVNLLNIVF